MAEALGLEVLIKGESATIQKALLYPTSPKEEFKRMATREQREPTILRRSWNLPAHWNLSYYKFAMKRQACSSKTLNDLLSMKHSRSITNRDILCTFTASIYSFIIDFFSFESPHSYEPEILSGRITSLIMV